MIAATSWTGSERQRHPTRIFRVFNPNPQLWCIPQGTTCRVFRTGNGWFQHTTHKPLYFHERGPRSRDKYRFTLSINGQDWILIVPTYQVRLVQESVPESDIH